MGQEEGEMYEAAIRETKRAIKRAKLYKLQPGTEQSLKAKIAEEVNEFLAATTVEEQYKEVGDILFNLVSYLTLLDKEMALCLLLSAEKLNGRIAKVGEMLKQHQLRIEGLSREELLHWYAMVKKEEEWGGV